MKRADKLTALTDLLKGKKTLTDLGPKRFYNWICNNGVCVSTQNWENKEIRLTESELEAFEAKQPKTDRITGIIIK
ncbi:MAG TPA: hypothetical protein VD794_11590 [Flavisolibacter sp.]|nr:hypothetical protein [Flavisolibacter sp.]